MKALNVTDYLQVAHKVFIELCAAYDLRKIFYI
jgi:hypothetical protein